MNKVLMNKSSSLTIDFDVWPDSEQHADNEPHDNEGDKWNLWSLG